MRNGRGQQARKQMVGTAITYVVRRKKTIGKSSDYPASKPLSSFPDGNSLGGSSLLATIRRLPLALHRRAGNRSKGTEHTTVAGLRLEQSSAGSTRVEVAAGIQRHGLLGFSEAVGTAKNRAQFHTFY